MPKPSAPPSAGMITAQQAAALLNLTAERLRQLGAAGAIPKAKSGYYPLVPVVQGYIAFLKDEGRRTSKSAADSRVRDKRADEIELRILERTGELITEARNEALGVIDEVIGGLRADLMSVPARVTADLEIRRKIEAAHDDVFRQAAKRASDRAKGLVEDLDAPVAGAEDDA